MCRSAVRRAATAFVLVLAVALGYVGWVAYDGRVADGLLGDEQRAAPAELPPPEGVEVPAIRPARPVLTAAGGRPPSPRGLRTALADGLRADDFGRHLGVLVEGLEGGRELLREGRGLFTPASTLKLLTTVAVLEQLGPEHRFTTRVVSGARRNEIVLVGGGDPLLARRSPALRSDPYPIPASTQALARRTASALAEGGTRTVRLRYDVSLFGGPSVSPAWEDSYVPDQVVTPISALWVDEGLGADGGLPRATDPAREAAQTFARQLAARGIEVRGRVSAGIAPTEAEPVAAVRSAPLEQIVGHTLLVSDNESAEVLLRHVAVADGRRGSFAQGVSAMTETLTGLGIDLGRARLFDGSGLARGNRLSLDALVDTLRIASESSQPDLRAAVTRLPVAGFSGSLRSRFTADVRPQTAPGLGVVRAKTGTLTGVHGLAGLVLDRDGAALLFVAIADRVRIEDTLDARAELEDLAAAIATCGCRQRTRTGGLTTYG